MLVGAHALWNEINLERGCVSDFLFVPLYIFFVSPEARGYGISCGVGGCEKGWCRSLNG